MKKKVVVIGAGINGLVAANYLRRGGCDVQILERKEKVGGACTYEWFAFEGKQYPLPTGASVFGMMPDFVFQETGLAAVIDCYRPKHPSLVYFGEETDPMHLFDDAKQYQEEARRAWGDHGDSLAYKQDLGRVRRFLLGLYRDAVAPTHELAKAVLGEDITRRWIQGSARDLFTHYFTADRMKIHMSMPVTESGPVPLDAPTSAFNVAALSAGSVLDGEWGFVKGGLWRLPLALAELNRNLGVEILTSVQVEGVDVASREVRFTREGSHHREKADAVFFATDPLTAARLSGDPALLAEASTKQYLGSSGKVVLVFREPARWIGSRGAPDFDAAFRFFYEPTSLEAFESSSRLVREKKVDFSPCAFQIYPEGAAMAPMGWNEPYDYVSVFFKDMALTKRGAELPAVKHAVVDRVLARLENPEALTGSVLFTPRDLQETFYFPEGNIDHMELTEGQNFLTRSFSADPAQQFHQLGPWSGVYLCAAGSFPCGSVAGTPGYLAAREWFRRG